MIAIGVAIVLAISVLGAWARHRFLVVTVDGHSMNPTLRDGQRLLARRRRPSARIDVGDIAVFVVGRETPGNPSHRVKRIVAIAHDPVPRWVGPGLGTHVPAGRVVVAGDNPRSEDSRQLGFIETAAILAIVPEPR